MEARLDNRFMEQIKAAESIRVMVCTLNEVIKRGRELGVGCPFNLEAEILLDTPTDNPIIRVAIRFDRKE